MTETTSDLLIVGGGINGAGIARDAAGRGLTVTLIERDDLAAHTSSQSTKLIHGGLRYLEHYEFRLVAEALAEREVLLKLAPHLIEPLAFVLPHEPHLRPAWMIRAGLFLYDRLGGRNSLPRSFAVRLDGSRWGAGLAPHLKRGFVYADARVDDARLVVANAIAARVRGATIRPRTTLVSARRDGPLWRAQIEHGGARSEIRARAMVNAAGPWVRDLIGRVDDRDVKADVRHVKGSHIVVPRVHDEEHAYILQNADKRIVFVIPYQQKYSLIGTTDVPVDHFDDPAIDDAEVDYLLAIANAYLAAPIARSDIVWTYSGVRPLYDDGAADPSAVTRDYVLKVDSGDAPGRAPLLSIFGGKVTTYRKLAEAAMKSLAPFFPAMRGDWTAGEPLPGGDFAGDRSQLFAELCARYPHLGFTLLRALGNRHGTRAFDVLGDAATGEDLGQAFGHDLTAREIEWFVREEWAMSADDVLWRRTKCGLPMTPVEHAAVRAHLHAQYALA
ncbi:MAG: glycerol-3-phosphate dehydrogenase [Burkholderiales bacterium]